MEMGKVSLPNVSEEPIHIVYNLLPQCLIRRQPSR